MLDLIEEAKKRIGSLGINLLNEPSNPDELMLNFSVEKVTNHIKNQTNLTYLPSGLNEIAVDMVVGEFLYMKKSMGQLDIESIDFSPIAKSIQDGDTNVTFAVEAGNTPESSFNALINYLRHNTTDFVRYRVLTW